jgi:hypothetical protein
MKNVKDRRVLLRDIILETPQEVRRPILKPLSTKE